MILHCRLALKQTNNNKNSVAQMTQNVQHFELQENYTRHLWFRTTTQTVKKLEKV